jgi:uncharacterized protein
VTVRVRLTDYQLAVAERLKLVTGAHSFEQLAIQAIDHGHSRTLETRWQAPRPKTPPPPQRPDHVQLDNVLPAATAALLAIHAGQLLRLQQLKDGQCVDLRVFEPAGRTFSAGRTRALHGINPTIGASLWSTAPEVPLMSIVADTAPGHDLCFPPCSEFEYEQQFGIAGHRGCEELHAETTAEHQVGAPLTDVFNLWLPSAIDSEGRLRSWPAACRKNDYLELRAEIDVVVILSTCPDDLFGSSQYEPGPVRVIVAGGKRSQDLPGWPSGPPASALARNEVSISVPEAALRRVDQVAEGGWLGHTRAAVLRALIFRLNESVALDRGASAGVVPRQQPD